MRTTLDTVERMCEYLKFHLNKVLIKSGETDKKDLSYEELIRCSEHYCRGIKDDKNKNE